MTIKLSMSQVKEAAAICYGIRLAQRNYGVMFTGSRLRANLLADCTGPILISKEYSSMYLQSITVKSITTDLLDALKLLEIEVDEIP